MSNTKRYLVQGVDGRWSWVPAKSFEDAASQYLLAHSDLYPEWGGDPECRLEWHELGQMFSGGLNVGSEEIASIADGYAAVILVRHDHRTRVVGVDIRGTGVGTPIEIVGTTNLTPNSGKSPEASGWIADDFLDAGFVGLIR